MDLGIAEFVAVAMSKGNIVRSFNKVARKEGWAWMMIEESEERMVVEFRRVPEGIRQHMEA